MLSNSHHADIDYDAIAAAAGKPIKFEDVDTSPYGFAVLEDGYKKLNWDGLQVLNVDDSGVAYYGNSGYITGLTSGGQVMYNPYTATQSSISLTTGTFTFDSVQMTSGWNLKQNVRIVGYDEDGNKIHNMTVKLTDAGPLDVEAHWTGVNKVTFFYTNNFKPDPDLLGTGNNVVFDDLVVTKIKGTHDSAGLDSHKVVADGAFGMNSHHESMGAIQHHVDAQHPVLVALA